MFHQILRSQWLMIRKQEQTWPWPSCGSIFSLYFPSPGDWCLATDHWLWKERFYEEVYCWEFYEDLMSFINKTMSELPKEEEIKRGRATKEELKFFSSYNEDKIILGHDKPYKSLVKYVRVFYSKLSTKWVFFICGCEKR